MDQSWESAKLEQIDRLLYFSIGIDQNGKLVEFNGWPEKWQSLKAAAILANRPLDLTLTMFDANAFNQLFSNKKSIQQLSDSVIDLLADEGVAGINLDVEVYAGATKRALKSYQKFVTDLSMKMIDMTPSRQLSVFYPMGGEVPLYEASTLRQLSAVVFQGYDAHWLAGPRAGPVAPLRGDYAVTWEKVSALREQIGLQDSATFISFPLYGYEWPVKALEPSAETQGSGFTTTFSSLPKSLLPDLQKSVEQRVQLYGAIHDPFTASASYKFNTGPGQWVEGWFDDWWTLRQKMNFLCQKKMAGMAFFPLGYDRHELIDHFHRHRTCIRSED